MGMINEEGFAKYNYDGNMQIVARTKIYVELSEWLTRQVLQVGDMRVPYDGGLQQIQFMGQWMTVARTDYCDDVCTHPYGQAGLSIPEARKFFLSLVGPRGARVTGYTFAVIDSESDG